MTVFTSSDVFTVPKGVKEIEIFLVGGGGAGNYGGGGGGYTKTESIHINPGDEINITIGSGSAKTIANEIYANCGSDGSYVYNEWFGQLGYGGNGGSGGGSKGYSSNSNGGSDGGDGGTTSDFVSHYQTTCVVSGGKGQGTTTRAFGESDGTLYAGGGGGGNDGKGGAGGGGEAVSMGIFYNPTDGSINTGGGGSGNNGGGGGKGGSGIAIIRWGY